MIPRQIIGSSAWLSSLWDRREVLAHMYAAIAWGMKDIAFREKELNRWRGLFPEALVTRLPDVGHFVSEEAPDAVAAAAKRTPVDCQWLHATVEMLQRPKSGTIEIVSATTR